MDLFMSKKAFKAEKAVDDGGKIAGFDSKTDTTLTAAKGLTTPLLLIHGKNDKHVPVENR